MSEHPREPARETVRQSSVRSKGSRPTVGSSRTSSGGAPSQRDGRGTPAHAAPPDSVATTCPANGGERHLLHHRLDRGAVFHINGSAEEAQVLGPR